ncbi:MAG: hypothetical protein WC953_00570 [Pseudomonas sp.]
MRFVPCHPLHLVLGLTVWSAWFVVLYGGLSVACQLAPPDPANGPSTWVNPLLWLSTLVVVAALLWAALRLWRAAPDQSQANRRYISLTSAALYAVSAFATLAVAAPVLFLPPCI